MSCMLQPFSGTLWKIDKITHLLLSRETVSATTPCSPPPPFKNFSRFPDMKLCAWNPPPPKKKKNPVVFFFLELYMYNTGISSRVALSLLLIPNRVSPLCNVQYQKYYPKIIYDLSADPLSHLRYTFSGYMSSFTSIQQVRFKADLAIDFISWSGYTCNKTIWKLNNDAYPDLPSDQICAYNIYVYPDLEKIAQSAQSTYMYIQAIPVVAWMALDQTCSSVLFSIFILV